MCMLYVCHSSHKFPIVFSNIDGENFMFLFWSWCMYAMEDKATEQLPHKEKLEH